MTFPNKGNRIFTCAIPLQLIYLKRYAVLTASMPDFYFTLFSTYHTCLEARPLGWNSRPDKVYKCCSHAKWERDLQLFPLTSACSCACTLHIFWAIRLETGRAHQISRRWEWDREWSWPWFGLANLTNHLYIPGYVPNLNLRGSCLRDHSSLSFARQKSLLCLDAGPSRCHDRSSWAISAWKPSRSQRRFPPLFSFHHYIPRND